MKKIVLLLLIVLSVINTFAQESDTLEIRRSEKGKINYARFKPNPNRLMNDDTTFLKSVLQAKKDDSFITSGNELDTIIKDIVNRTIIKKPDTL